MSPKYTRHNTRFDQIGRLVHQKLQLEHQIIGLKKQATIDKDRIENLEGALGASLDNGSRWSKDCYCHEDTADDAVPCGMCASAALLNNETAIRYYCEEYENR